MPLLGKVLERLQLHGRQQLQVVPQRLLRVHRQHVHQLRHQREQVGEAGGGGGGHGEDGDGGGRGGDDVAEGWCEEGDIVN